MDIVLKLCLFLLYLICVGCYTYVFHCYYNICSDLMAKRKEENFFSPDNAKRPRQEELEDFDKDGDEDECTVPFTSGTSSLVSAALQN